MLAGDNKPSKTFNTYWLYAIHPEYNEIKKNVNYSFTGKWLIFPTLKEVDKVWKKIQKATESGELGFASKVSTMAPTRYDPNTKCICVYTTDYRNKEDVLKVREALRKLGFKNVLAYKTDEATERGIYGTDQEFLYKE